MAQGMTMDYMTEFSRERRHQVHRPSPPSGSGGGIVTAARTLKASDAVVWRERTIGGRWSLHAPPDAVLFDQAPVALRAFRRGV
jgi:hypothetical protein